MNNSQNYELLRLVQLAVASGSENGLTSDELLRDDPKNATKLRQILDLLNSQNGSDIENGVSSTSPEIVAAYLSGSLKAESAAKFERKCWKSERLMREVISACQFIHEEKSTSHNPIPVSEKSISVLDSILQNSDAATNRKEIDQIDSVFNSEISNPSSENQVGSAESKSRVSLIAFAVVAAALLISLTLFLLIQFNAGDNRARESKKEQIVDPKSENSKPDLDDLVPNFAGKDGNSKPERNLQKDIVTPKITDEKLAKDDSGENKKTDPAIGKNGPTKLVEKPKSKDPGPRKTESIKPEPKDLDKPKFAVNIEWQNKKQRGIILKRNAKSPWIGMNTGLATSDLPTEYCSLPNSWGEMNIEGIGEVILPGNSQFIAYREEGEADITVEIVNGGLIFQNLKKDSNFNLKYGNYKMRASGANDAGLIARFSYREFETFTYKGRLTLQTFPEFVRISDRGKAVITDNSKVRLWGLYFMAYPPNQSYRNFDFRPPSRPQALTSAMRKKFASSEDAIPELRKLAESRSTRVRKFAVQSLLNIESEKSFLPFINSRQQVDKSVAYDWLFTSSRISRDRLFASPTIKSEWPTQFISSLNATCLNVSANRQSGSKSKMKVYKKHATTMAGMLTHASVSVRGIAHQSLVQTLGEVRSIKYSPTLSPERLAALADAWKRHIELLASKPNSPFTSSVKFSPKQKSSMGSGSRSQR